MDKEFQCCQCLQEFNGTSRTPHVLPTCGHSICHSCITQFIESDGQLSCNEDQIQCEVEKDIKNFPYNLSILNLIKKRRSSKCQTAVIITPEDHTQRHSAQEVSEFSGTESSLNQSQSLETLPKTNICPIHQKIIELVCMEDGQYICVNCALFGNHKFHNFKPIDVYIKELEQSINDITPIFKEVQGYLTDIESNKHQTEYTQLLETSREEAKQQVQQQFKELIHEMTVIENIVIEKINENYELQKQQNLIKLNSDYSNLKDIADAWLKNTGQQICAFIEGEQQQKCQNLDQKLFSHGQFICSEYQNQNQSIQDMIHSVQEENTIKIPIEQIKEFTQKIIGLAQNHENVEEKDRSKDNNDISLIDDQNKLLDSDVYIQNHQQQSQSQSQQQQQQFEYKIQINHNQPQSQQPTQPTSPQCDFSKTANYFQTPQLQHRKERSHTSFQTEPSLDHGSITARQKQKQPTKNLKFTNNSKMNEKLSACLSLLHEDKSELIDLCQIDFNEQIVGILEEYMKKTKLLKVLKMSKCKITDDIFQKLILILEDSYVNTLHLQQNQITEKSLDFLMVHLKKSERFCHLKSIYLNGNGMLLHKAKKRIDDLKKLGIAVQI